MRFICRQILKLMGWKIQGSLPKLNKYIVVFAPHTSNVDFVIGALFYISMGIKIHFLIKKEAFFFPLNLLLKTLGGIPVDRQNSGDIIDRMADEFKNRDKFILAITPEGTRRKVAEWKKGFYVIANKADVNIILGSFDFRRRLILIGEPYKPTGSLEEEMRKIKLWFKDIKGRHPEKFTIGDLS